MNARMLLLMLLFISTATRSDTVTHIYECHVNGERIFSDHVCGDNAVQHEVKVASRMDAVDIPEHIKVPSPKTRKNHSTVDLDSRRQRCIKLNKLRDRINDQMRAGFSAKQDAKLHDRLNKLGDEYFRLRCNGMSAAT